MLVANETRRKQKQIHRLMPIQVTELRHMLEAKRLEIINDVGTTDHSPGDPQVFVDSFHVVSTMNTTMDKSDLRQTLGLTDIRHRLLGEIEAALARIDDGSYGVCEQTGRLIPVARLLAIPWTRYRLEVVLHQNEHHRTD